MSASLGEVAEALLGLGWSVIPLQSPLPDSGCSCGRPTCPGPGKHPRVPWERWQERRPPLDVLRRWWRHWPDANIGVITGSVSGLFVIDVDPRHGGDLTLTDFERSFGRLPRSVEVRTGGGGRHLYFTHPPRPVPSKPLAPGLDVKGEGGLVVAPPSLHPSGQPYRWTTRSAPGDRVLAPPPPWLLALVGQARPGAQVAPPDVRGSVRTGAEREEFARLWASLGVELEPGDRMYRCPLHDDHNPSLHVDAEGCRWMCFGCHRAGGLGRLRQLVGGPPPEAGAAPAVPVTLAGGSTVEVAGEAAFQDQLLALTGGRRRFGGVSMDVIAHLVPEPGNPHDPHAIAVLVGGAKVGYLRRTDAGRFRRAVAEAVAVHGEATCVATIRGGWERPGDVGRFGVKLWLATPPARVRVGPAPPARR